MDYSNGKNVLLKRPEPGRPIYPVKKEEVNINIDKIADAVVKAITNKISVTNNVVVKEDNFDSMASLNKLADAMIIQGNKESNIEGIGNIKEVKKDKKETDNTIDLLSKLGE